MPVEGSLQERSGWNQAAVLSFSRIVRDRRVLRQCTLLSDMGYEPVVLAYATPGDAIPFKLESLPVPLPTTVHRIKTVAQKLPAHLGLRAAKTGFWVEPRHRWALAQLRLFRPNLVIANDWPALVVAAAYKREYGCLIHYDTHEFATLEFDERAFWRLVYKPMVKELERDSIDAADSISTVGPKLAEALQEKYNLARQPAVVRNIPGRIPLDDNVDTTWPLRILYHGQVLPGRGLESLIDSVHLWHTEHRLTIRGDGNPEYISSLQARMAATGRGKLITFERAVMPDEVMPVAARTADVGVHFTPLDTDQRHFSLPNKLFEYIGAGLAVAVSPGADLRQLVEAHGVGVVSETASSGAVADAINMLTVDSVSAFKTAARQARLELCWENEQRILRDVIGNLIGY